MKWFDIDEFVADLEGQLEMSESKKVAGVQYLHLGHLHVEFEDGSVQVFPRGTHEDKDLKVGSFFPPLPRETSDAVDSQTSEAPAQQGVAADGETAIEDEAGAAPEPGDGAREERQQGAQAQDGQPAS